MFTIIFGFLSHFIVDSFAKVTYHTPEPLKEDRFWVSWAIISNGITIIFVVWVILIGQFWFFFWGGFFSILVDIYDWGILRPIQNKGKNSNDESYWKQGYFFHKLIDKIREEVPPFSWLPNWNYERKGVIVELAIIVIFWILVIILLPFVSI